MMATGEIKIRIENDTVKFEWNDFAGQRSVCSSGGGLGIYSSPPASDPIEILQHAAAAMPPRFDVAGFLAAFTAQSGLKVETGSIQCNARFCLRFVAHTDAVATNPSDDSRHFLDLVYKTESIKGARHAMDVVANQLDDLLNDGNFEECGVILRAADPSRMSDPVIVAFLGITLAAKRKLSPDRAMFYASAMRAIESRSDADMAKDILERYR